MTDRLIQIGDDLNAFQIPSADTLTSNKDFIAALLPLMRWTCDMMQITVALVNSPKEQATGKIKAKAVVFGHMARLSKLYYTFLQNVEGGQDDIAAIIARLIFEAEVKMSYLIANPKSWRSYILTSFRAEREILIDLFAKQKQRKLLPIEKRIVSSIRRALRKEGIPVKRLLANKWTEMDGKNFRGLLESLKRENEYAYGFANSSAHIHGTWLDLRRFHLRKKNRGFQPNIYFRPSDPRLAGPITFKCLETILIYINWSCADLTGAVKLLTNQMLKDVKAIDDMHESWLNAGS